MLSQLKASFQHRFVHKSMFSDPVYNTFMSIIAQSSYNTQHYLHSPSQTEHSVFAKTQHITLV